MISFSVIKPKIISVSQLSVRQSISFANLSMAVDSDYYRNKLYKFRRGLKKIKGPGVGLRTPW